MHMRLFVVVGPEKGRTFSLVDGQTLIIGRGQASDTKLNDPRMSRVHCLVQIDGGKAILIDSDSAAGTLIDGEAVEKRELKPGEIFRAGDSQFRFELEAPPEQSTLVDQRIPDTGAETEAPDGPLNELLGEKLSEFELIDILARGSTGMVFKARDTKKDRIVAVKVLAPEFTRSEEQKQRFIRAMETMMPIRHENLVEVYKAGKKGPYCWAAMEYVDGESMTQVIQRIGVSGMLDWREAFRVALHVGRALEAAYEHKIIHRNVRPPNILRRKSDKLTKLGDMMLAKALEGSLARDVTGPGQLIGDVAYMSPERTRFGDEADSRSDIYGLGATCYALLTGRPPFEGRSLPELIKKIRSDEPEKPTKYQLSIPGLFADAVLRMLSKRPEERHDNPTALLLDLERIAKYEGLKLEG